MKNAAPEKQFREPRQSFFIQNISLSTCKVRSCRFEKSAKRVLGQFPNKLHRGNFLPRDALLATMLSNHLRFSHVIKLTISLFSSVLVSNSLTTTRISMLLS